MAKCCWKWELILFPSFVWRIFGIWLIFSFPRLTLLSRVSIVISNSQITSLISIVSSWFAKTWQNAENENWTFSPLFLYSPLHPSHPSLKNARLPTSQSKACQGRGTGQDWPETKTNKRPAAFSPPGASSPCPSLSIKSSSLPTGYFPLPQPAPRNPISPRTSSETQPLSLTNGDHTEHSLYLSIYEANTGEVCCNSLVMA